MLKSVCPAQVLKKLEACGTKAGRPKQPAGIVDCGELPSRRQILKKLQAERAELDSLKKDPLQV